MERQRIARLLPEIYQRTLPTKWWQAPSADISPPPSVLGAFLAVMEALHTPDEAILDHLDIFFDPRQAPEDWLPVLARWLDLDRFLTSSGEYPAGPVRLRQLILAAAALSQERGTSAGLKHFLETATGIEGIKITPADGYHIVVTCPAPDPAYGMTHAQFCNWFQELVTAEKPAYVTCEIFLKTADGRTTRIGPAPFPNWQPVQVWFERREYG